MFDSILPIQILFYYSTHLLFNLIKLKKIKQYFAKWDQILKVHCSINGGCICNTLYSWFVIANCLRFLEDRPWRKNLTKCKPVTIIREFPAYKSWIKRDALKTKNSITNYNIYDAHKESHKDIIIHQLISSIIFLVFVNSLNLLIIK